MSIKFESNVYYSAASSGEMFSDEKTFEKEAKSNLQFSYASVTYIDYSQNYDFNYGLPSNKIAFSGINEKRNKVESDIFLKAIPGALWAALKTIYHLACAIFAGGWDAILGDTDTFKAHIFYAGRNIIEVIGRVVSLFDQEYGQYYIEESQFHETCYDLFLDERAKKADDKDQLEEGPAVSNKFYPGGHCQPASFAHSNYEVPQSPVSHQTVASQLNQGPQDDASVSSCHLKQESEPLQSCLVQKTTSNNLSRKPNFAEKFNQIKATQKDNDVKEKAFAALAEECLAWNELEMSLKVIKEIYSSANTDLKEKFISKIAEEYLKLGNLETALKMIKEIYSSANTNLKEKFISKLAEEYLKLGNLETALKVIKEIYSSANTDLKEKFIFRLADMYLGKKDPEKAHKMIKEIYSSDSKSRKEDYFVKVAYAYFNLNRIASALEVMEDVGKTLPASQRFYLDLLERYIPRVIGHDEVIIDVVRSYVMDLGKETWLKNFTYRICENSADRDKIHSEYFKEKQLKESNLSSFLIKNVSTFPQKIREQHAAKGKSGITEALAEITNACGTLVTG